MNAPLRADHLSRSFGGRSAVTDVSFEVAAGEVVGFLGPNGAGKTTTMRMLLGLLRPAAGHATRPPRVGYLPENHRGQPSLSVRGYLRYLASTKAGGVSRAERDLEVERVLDAADATALSRRPLGRLSKGQLQRAGLAQALLWSPPAYVLDEPTVGLDPKQVVDMRGGIRRLADDDGAAVLLSTHLLSEAAAVCDRVVIIVEGRVVATERPGEVDDLEARFLRLVGEATIGASVHEGGGVASGG